MLYQSGPGRKQDSTLKLGNLWKTLPMKMWERFSGTDKG